MTDPNNPDHWQPGSSDQESESEKEHDALDDSRLSSKKQNREFQEALESNPEVFTSFSEGMASVDKFDIVDGLEAEEIETDASAAIAGDSFHSFSEGIASVDKFELTGTGAMGSLGSLTSMPAGRRALVDFLSDPLAPLNQLLACVPDDCRLETLEGLLARVAACPWTDQVVVMVGESLPVVEYSYEEHQIVLDRKRSVPAQTLDFVHQLYHAAHRNLVRIYMEGMVDEETFIDCFLWTEVAAVVTELSVRKELELFDCRDTSVVIRRAHGTEELSVIRIIKKRGLPALRKLIEASLPRGCRNQQESILRDQGRHLYTSYTTTFEEKSRQARRLFEQAAGREQLDGKI